MPHLPHRSMKIADPKPAVAEVELPISRLQGLERHMGTTRIPKSRVLKPPIT